jgi:dihydrofolate reductase
MGGSRVLPVVLVLAASENGVIGKNNALPWDLPDDLKHFKHTTMGCPILMGRKTYESVGRPLPGRTNIVLTKDSEWSAPGVEAFQTLDAALDRANQQALLDGAPALCVIGGAEIYRLCLPIADHVVLTQVHGHVEGDAHFDLSQLNGWEQRERQEFLAGERNSHDFSVVKFVRPS